MLLSEKAGQIRQMRSSNNQYNFGTVVLQQDHSVAVQIKAKMAFDSKSCYKYPGTLAMRGLDGVEPEQECDILPSTAQLLLLCCWA